MSLKSFSNNQKVECMIIKQYILVSVQGSGEETVKDGQFVTFHIQNESMEENCTTLEWVDPVSSPVRPHRSSLGSSLLMCSPPIYLKIIQEYVPLFSQDTFKK